METKQLYEHEESFRDKIATVDEKGKRLWVYPKKPSGKLYKYRTYVSLVLLAILFGVPFIKVNGDPLFLFNLFERKFIVFGFTFWPHDFYLFVLAVISFIVFILLFTAVYGRVFCGWACPQTIFMEMVFRKIEYWIEGDYNKQRRLNKGPWNKERIWKKGLKFSIFYVISFFIGNTLLAWIVGTDQLFSYITSPPAEHPVGFSLVIGFSFVFFFIFSYFREQACTVVCPYARLQGVLLDNDSVVVAYDFVRGEPRGKIKKVKPDDEEAKKRQEALGDCIDCKLCVAVCPTGIDIRNGTQLECVNCTACIDACNEVMEKVDRPKGLIRFASHNNIAENKKFRITPRIMAYSAVLVILIGVLGFSMASRADFETTLLRAPGQTYTKVDDTTIRNIYTLQLVNKTRDELPVDLKLTSHEGTIQMIGEDEIVVPAQDMTEGVFFIDLPKDVIDGGKTKVTIEVYSGDKRIDKVKTSFLGPIIVKQ